MLDKWVLIFIFIKIKVAYLGRWMWMHSSAFDGKHYTLYCGIVNIYSWDITSMKKNRHSNDLNPALRSKSHATSQQPNSIALIPVRSAKPRRFNALSGCMLCLVRPWPTGATYIRNRSTSSGRTRQRIFISTWEAWKSMQVPDSPSGQRRQLFPLRPSIPFPWQRQGRAGLTISPRIFQQPHID